MEKHQFRERDNEQMAAILDFCIVTKSPVASKPIPLAYILGFCNFHISMSSKTLSFITDC